MMVIIIGKEPSPEQVRQRGLLSHTYATQAAAAVVMVMAVAVAAAFVTSDPEVVGDRDSSRIDPPPNQSAGR